jgi:hypothetical protein
MTENPNVAPVNIFELLASEAATHQLRFLLIGGHAVNAHGASRMTFDVDILVRRAELVEWRKVAEQMGFVFSSEQRTFVQFTAPEGSGTWPMDLMLVNDQTFEKMWAESREVHYKSAVLRVPLVEHLIALKLHALRQNLYHRALKDFQDIVDLVDVNRIDLRGEMMQDIFSRYGTPDFYRKISIACDQWDEDRK